MPWIHGRSSSHIELLDKLIDFVTDPAFMGSDAWSIVKRDSSDVILKGKGKGDDNIFVGIKPITNADKNWYFWFLNGFIEYDSQQAFIEQPGSIRSDNWSVKPLTWKQAVDEKGHLISVPNLWYWSLDDICVDNLHSSIIDDKRLLGTPIIPFFNGEGQEYWIIANSYCIILVTRVGSHFESCFLGFFNPAAQESQYAYPMLIGGSGTGATGLGSFYTVTGAPRPTPIILKSFDFSQQLSTADHRHFISPGTCWENIPCTGTRYRKPDGTWGKVVNYKQPMSIMSESINSNVNYWFEFHEEAQISSGSKMWPTMVNTKDMNNDLDNEIVLLPVYLFDESDVVGTIPNCYWVSGKKVSEDQILEVAGVQYLVVRNADWIRFDHWKAKGFIQASNQSEFWAVKLV